MIRIYVEGRELVIGRDTTMTVELSNALFASPDIEGDVSFTFTLPVEGNERLLGFPNLPQCGGARKLPCTVYCSGSLNWNGQLVVQKASRDSLSAALVINPYPDGFGKRSMTENEDSEIVVSDSLETHDTAWERFLAASVHDPDVKFAPFFNEEGYGSDNDSWGFWNGRARRKIVNALLFDGDGNLIDDTFGNTFSKAHNRRFDVSEEETDPESGESTNSTHTEFNQLAFCPQIRIARILDLWCRNAGYKFINHLGENLESTFIQSQKSLDATQSQFGIETGITITTHNGQTEMPYVHDGAVWLPYSGWWELDIQCDTLTAQFHVEHPTEAFDPAHAYAVLRWPIKIFLYTGNCNAYELGTEQCENGTIVYKEVFLNDGQTILFGHDRAHIETADIGLKYAVVAQYDYYESEGLGGGYYSQPEYKRTIWQHVPDVDMTIQFHLITPDQKQSGFNIFRSRFRVPELLPDVTNSSFMKTMLDTFGLCYYISAKTKTIELVPYAALEGAKSIDLTEWELTRETEVQTPEETMQTFRLKPLKDEGYNENLRLPDQEGNHLPDAYTNHEHFALLKKTNTLYHATVQEHEDYNWVEGWVEHGGNPDRLEHGSGEEQNREPGVSVPHQRFTGSRIPNPDAETGETPQLMVADTAVCSDLYNVSDKPSDIILTQYRGFRRLANKEQVGGRSTYIYKEVMLPVWNGEFSLTAKGENSLGERYVKPVLELANHKTVTYKLRLPANMMQPVEDLLRPSELPPERQTRFIVIRNVKTVPEKITFQIDNDRDDTVLCQIEAVKVY